MDWIYLFDLIRLSAYAVTSVSAFFLAVDDHVHGRRAEFAWAAFSLQYFASIALFALDLSAAVSWMEQRFFLTPFAVVGAIALPYVLAERFSSRSELRQEEEGARRPSSQLDNPM